MKTQKTPISLSSGIWCVTVSSVSVCFVFTFDACSKIYIGASRKCTLFNFLLFDHLISAFFQCASTSCLTALCSDVEVYSLSR